jgi:hypothetical protein
VETLPPRISDTDLLATFAEILAVRAEPADTARLRLRLIQQAGSWQALADVAVAQGAMAPFIWSLTRRALLLPIPNGKAEFDAETHPTAKLKAVYEQHLMRRRRQQEQLAAIVATLNGDNIEPFLLKGARYLLAPEDSWRAARDMRDIDFLVQAEDAQRASGALEALGYSVGPQNVPVRHHLPELWHSEFPSAVEIHTEALAFSSRSTLRTDEVWRMGQRYSTQLGSFILLPDEWHLLHGLLHHEISDRGHVRRILAVKPLWEFAMLGSELTGSEWRSIAVHMAGRGQADVLGSWITQAATLYGFGVPSGVDISAASRTHAIATLTGARAPEWLRRCRFLIEQFRFAFSPTTLGARYGIPTEAVSFGTIGHHLRVVLHRYRGQILRRLFGTGGRPS